MWFGINIPGKRFGKPKIGSTIKKKAKKLTTIPIHHAPTHWGSFGVKSTLYE